MRARALERAAQAGARPGGVVATQGEHRLREAPATNSSQEPIAEERGTGKGKGKGKGAGRRQTSTALPQEPPTRAWATLSAVDLTDEVAVRAATVQQVPAFFRGR